MKIGNPADKPVGLTPAALAAETARAAAGSAAAGAASAAAVPDPSAKVELSSGASTLMSTGSSAEFDADKVSRISQAIASGTFKIDAALIADKLIANAQELLAGTRR